MLDRDWSTTLIIGGGPSLTQEQVDYARQSDARIIAVNDAYRLAPDADVLFACDIQWWYYHRKHVGTQIECWTLDGVGTHFNKRHNDPRLNQIPFTRTYGIYDEMVHHGGNSGYVAIQLARLFGSERIVLIGFDHQATGGKKHWFGDHDPSHFRVNVDHIDLWKQRIERLIQDMDDVDIVNCSIETSIQSARRSTLHFEI